MAASQREMRLDEYVASIERRMSNGDLGARITDASDKAAIDAAIVAAKDLLRAHAEAEDKAYRDLWGHLVLALGRAESAESAEG